MPAIEPFDSSGVVRNASGIKRFESLPASLVAMFRAAVDGSPGAEAVVQLDGPRGTFTELWDRAARVAGALREAGVARGDRVAIRYGNGVDWVPPFLGNAAPGALAVPVNTRF